MMQMPDGTYVHTQMTGSDDFASQPSIMFSDSRLLSLNGSNGVLSTELLKLGDHGMTLGRVASTGHEIELKETDSITFLFPLSGFLDVLVAGREYKIVPGRPLAFRPTERRTRARPILQNNFVATTLQVATRRVAMLTEACEISPEKPFAADATNLAGPVGQWVTRHLPRLTQDLLLRPDAALPQSVLTSIAVLIDEQLCELIGVSTERPGSRSFLPALHRVRRAEEIMRARSDEPLSILEVALSLGVSLRSLQLAFKEIHGVSPRDVLNRMRLEKARQRLLAGQRESQVTTVALESGFSHLSRFAQAYTRFYGERPSKTLARRA